MLVLRVQKKDIFSLFRKVILYSGHRGALQQTDQKGGWKFSGAPADWLDKIEIMRRDQLTGVSRMADACRLKPPADSGGLQPVEGARRQTS